MAIIKNKYKDKLDKKIKDFPNGSIAPDFTRKIVYDNETNVNPTILRTPKYGDDLDTTEFAKLVSDLVYNDSIINEEVEKHNYLYSNGVIKNYKKEFEIYDKNLFQVLASYEVSTFTDKSSFSLKHSNSIEGNFVNRNYCNFYFYTNDKALLSKYDFFYKEFKITGIITRDNETQENLKDDYSFISFNSEIDITNEDIQSNQNIGIVLYLPTNVKNTTPYKTKNYINNIIIGNGALKIGDTFIDIKKDTYVSRTIKNDSNLNQIKIPDIIETNFKNSFRTRRDILIAYYDQTNVMNNISFEGIIDLILGDERINMYSPLDNQLLTMPRIKKINYMNVNGEHFHRIYLDDLCILKGINHNKQEILFRKVNQSFTIKNSANNVFDGEYLIKNIDYVNRTIDFVHPSYDGNFTQPEDNDNIVGYYGHLLPNIYILYSVLVYKDNGFVSETQILKADEVFDYVGLESGNIKIDKTVLEINESGMFEISKNDIKHLKNLNSNLLEYDDGQSSDVPSKNATKFTLKDNGYGDYILRPAEQQLPNEYDEIGLNSLSNSHFIITENNFNVINNSKIILSEVYLGVKNSLSSIGTEGIKIKIEQLEMLYPLDTPKRIENISPNRLNADEVFITLFQFDTDIEVDDILFISYNQYNISGQILNGNGDYQTVTIKRIENEKLVVNKLNSTYSAEFKFNHRYPIYFNIIKKNKIKKVCESLLTNDEIKDQIINGLNGKFGEKNSYSKLKFDKFIDHIDPNNDLLQNGIKLSQTKDFGLNINSYYYISVSGFVINNIAGTYSSILIEDFNQADDTHFKKTVYYEINIKSFKGRYPNSLIISDDFGDINNFNITRTFSPFFRKPKYSIMAYDFSNLDISLHDIPEDETVVLFDPLCGRFKFHPNVTPTKIYFSYYTTENLHGASEAENFIYKRGNDSNDTIRGKIQELDNKYVYGASFSSPISIDGVIVNKNLNYKGPFVIKDNQVKLKNNANFVNLDIDRYEIEIDKDSNYEIIDLTKNSVYLKNNIVEKNNEIQSLNRQFLDQLYDQKEKDQYEKPFLNKKEELVFNISEDTSINKNILNTKKWQNQIKLEKEINIPFLSNKKFNKINFYNFNKNLIIDCNERTKTENLPINETNLSDILKEFVYRKLNEKNYKYSLKKDYTEDNNFSFNDSNENKQLNKMLIKASEDFGKSEMVNAFVESENNELISRKTYEYDNLNLNKTNSDNYIVINEHIINFDLKKINKKYSSTILYTNSLTYNENLPVASLVEGKLYFFSTAGYNTVLQKQIEIGDFIVRSVDGWDFYKKNDIFNISRLIRTDDFSFILNDFNEININYDIIDFNNSFQKLLLNAVLVRQELVKINESNFFVSLLLKDTNDTYSLYLQFFELDENNFFYCKKINGLDYLKIATSQLSSDLTKIDKNNLFYSFLSLDDNKILFSIMSLEGFIFKYIYLDNLLEDDITVFVNDKKIKNNPKLLKLNNEIFCIIFNTENSFNYDTSIGDLEIKIYNIEDKRNIILSYAEKSLNLSNVDKILIDNIKNNSDFNFLRINDDTFIIFYSNINTHYLNMFAFNDDNDEYIFEAPLGVLNCFKIIKFLKTETNYQFDVSDKKTVFYQNIGESAFPPKIYPFKINSNIFGVNYIQYDLNNQEISNKMFSYDVYGVVQKIYFENEYTQQNPENIKYIYGINNRQAIEFSRDNIKIHNFDNDYSQLVTKESVDYKKYFTHFNNTVTDYNSIFENKLMNPIEIKTIKDVNGNVFNKKIIFFFTKDKQNNEIKINLIDTERLNVDFNNMTKFSVIPSNAKLVEQDGYIFYQSETVYFENKIYLYFLFLSYDDTMLVTRLSSYFFDITDKMNNEGDFLNPTYDIVSINGIKRIDQADNKNKFFFNRIGNSKIEIYCLRELSINNQIKSLVSKYTLNVNEKVFQENRNAFDYSENQFDDFIASKNIINIFRLNINNEIKFLAEEMETKNGIDNYIYFYVENDFQIFNLHNSINKFNINYVYYNINNKEILILGDTLNQVVSYVFNFNNNLFDFITLDSLNNNKYNFFIIEDTDKECYFYYKISGSELNIKIFNKKTNENLLLAYTNSYDYGELITDIAFNDYLNIYDTFVYFPNFFIRETWNFFPMNNISNNKNLLNYDIYENKLALNDKQKNVFSSLCITAVLIYDSNRYKNVIYIYDEKFIRKINNDTLEGLTFYINNNGNICIFKILEKIPDTNYYEITYLVDGDNKRTLLNKRLDFIQYKNSNYSFYKKSYQSLSIKLNMFNYKGSKRNEYEIYRKNNYFYDKDINYENNTLYKSNIYIIKGEHKNFQIIYNIDDEYEFTVIYGKKYLIINNDLYSFENKTKILIESYLDNDKINFICEKTNNSNFFLSFKKNQNYLQNFILNNNYGAEQIDFDYTKKELYKFIQIKDGQIDNVLSNSNYQVSPYAVKKLFNGYILFLLKIKKDNIIKIAHILYREDGFTIDYYNQDYSKLYQLPHGDEILGYSLPNINSYGYTSIFVYKKDSSKDILQFGIDGDGGICKLRGINEL